MNFHLFFLIIVSLINFFLGFFVWQNNKKSAVNKSFWIFICFVILWIIVLYVSDLPSQISQALFWNKLTLVSGLLFVSSFVYFSLVFIRREGFFIILKPPFSFVILSLLLFLILITLLTNLIVARVEIYEWGINIIPGKLYSLVGGFYLAGATIGLGSLISKYKKSSGVEKVQVQYLFIGFLLSTIGILITNLIHPAITGINPYAKYGPYFITFFIFFTTLAITRYHLFEIKVILTEILVGAIAIILFIQALTASTFWLKILGFGLLLLFGVVGYFLIKSVLKEIELRGQLQKAYQELKKLDATKSEFISIASHQLRTPLTAVKGYISMILEGTYGQITEKIIKPLTNVYQSNERLIKLVNDLLNLSRLEAGKIEFNPEPTSLRELISDVIEELKIDTEKKGLYLKLNEVKGPIPEVIIDRDKIRQVILNIIDNAIKYTQEGGITIELEKINNEVKIRISDTGEGMTKKEIDSLFKMFSRATAGTQLHSGGAGLGLHIAKRFIEMHSGKIWAESRGKGKGSTFFIQLLIKLDEKLLKIKTKEIIKRNNDIFEYDKKNFIN